MAIKTGTSGNDTLIGTSGIDTLRGLGGNDFLVGGLGNDTLDGSTGGDTISFAGIAGRIVANLSVATQQNTISAGSDVLKSIEHVLGGSGNDTLTGNSGNNRLDGSIGNDTLNGGAGNDLLIGGSGIDTASYADATTAIRINLALTTAQNTGGAGIDTLSGIERVRGGAANDTFTGSSSDNYLIGGAGVDTLSGGSGNDIMDGGSSADFMNGGSGNDLFIIDNAGDNIIGGSGTNTLRLAGAVNKGIGDPEQIAVFEGDGDDNNLSSTATTPQTIRGLNGDDVIAAGSSNDRLEGGNGDDLLNGRDGNDTLIGGPGADFLDGGEGNDLFVVDNAGDTTNEASFEGIDEVQSSITFRLSSAIEVLRLTGTANIHGTGTVGDPDTLIGNDGSNILSGLSGNDTLTGNAGNDTLDGGAGADRMIAGLGNDTYIVDNASDIVTEGAAQGTDRVLSAVSFTLGTNVERLTLTGASAINGTGNTVSNIIVGNEAVNTLAGGSGADTMDGGFGNDTVVGGSGADRLTGGLGGDAFRFTAVTDGAAVAGNTTRGAIAGDAITDFVSGIDVLQFSQAAFDPGNIMGTIDEGIEFSIISAAYNGTNAGANSNHADGLRTFVFSASDSTLYFDANGAGAGYTVIASFDGATVGAQDITIGP